MANETLVDGSSSDRVDLLMLSLDFDLMLQPLLVVDSLQSD
jgi:hypothetical protein